MDEWIERQGKTVVPATSFVGRQTELAQLEALLGRPECRLLTIVGPGGIGKTRLAFQAVLHLPVESAGFVSLQGISQADHVPTAVADALGMQLRGQAEPWAQLHAALGDRRLLLVLDNAEHLPGLAPHLSALLQRAPQLKLLVTSREALRLQQEWLFPIEGLALPGQAEATQQDASALRLFAARAQQVRPDFDLEVERPAVMRICRAVGGMPLAIELAAAWTRVLSCDAIADEIAHNLAFLETTLRDVSERHRSMRAVLEQSWVQLSESEQIVLARLAVFPGSFSREGAASVAGATLPILVRLVDHALLRRDAAGRYQLHELVRQYAAQRLGAVDAAAREAELALARYLADFLGVQFVAATSGRQRAAIAAVLAERETIRAAWPLLVRTVSGEALRRAAYMLAKCYFFCGPYHEGQEAFVQAAAALRESLRSADDRAVLAGILAHQGFLGIRTGALADAGAWFGESAALFASAGSAAPAGFATDPEIGLSLLALIRGDYGEAGRRAEQVRARSAAQGHVGNATYAWYLLTEVALAAGQVAAARHAAEQGLAAARQVGDDWFSAYLLSQLGQIAMTLEQYHAAEAAFQESYALRDAYGDLQGVAIVLLDQARVATGLGDFERAVSLAERSRAIAARIGDRGGVAAAHDALGAALLGRQSYGDAREHLRTALNLAAAMTYSPVALSALAHSAELLLALGRAEQAAGLLTAVLGDPACPERVRSVGERLLQRCAQLLPAPALASAAPSASSTRDLAIRQALAELALPLRDAGPPQGLAATPVVQHLAEPLTGRELDILRSIAEGCSNQEIADRLVLSVGTIKWYTGQIYGKLGVRTRTQAVAHARSLGLLS